MCALWSNDFNSYLKNKCIGSSIEKCNLAITVYEVYRGISPAIRMKMTDMYGRRPITMITIVVIIALKNIPGNIDEHLYLPIKMLQYI